MRLTGKRVYLDMLTREDCRRICELTEFDPDALVEQPCIGFGPERADDWYADIQRRQCDTMCGWAYTCVRTTVCAVNWSAMSRFRTSTGATGGAAWALAWRG